MSLSEIEMKLVVLVRISVLLDFVFQYTNIIQGKCILLGVITSLNA